MCTSGTLGGVPLDVENWILSFLVDAEDVLSARRVCKRWNVTLMNPRPIVARIASPWDFFNIAETLVIFYRDGVPFSLTKGALFTVIVDRYQLAEIKLSVRMDEFEKETNFLIPAKTLSEFLSAIKRSDQRGEVRIAIFERVEKFAIVYSGTDQIRFSGKLAAGPSKWDRLHYSEYHLAVPFNVGLVASLRSDLDVVHLRAGRLQGGVVVFTLDVGGANPKLDHYFVEPGEGTTIAKGRNACALCAIDPKQVDVRAEYEHVFAVKVKFELLWKACRYLRKFKGVDVCFQASEDDEQVPIVLKHGTDWCEINWAIAPVKEQWLT